MSYKLFVRQAYGKGSPNVSLHEGWLDEGGGFAMDELSAAVFTLAEANHMVESCAGEPGTLDLLEVRMVQCEPKPKTAYLVHVVVYKVTGRDTDDEDWSTEQQYDVSEHTTLEEARHIAELVAEKAEKL